MKSANGNVDPPVPEKEKQPESLMHTTTTKKYQKKTTKVKKRSPPCHPPATKKLKPTPMETICEPDDENVDALQSTLGGESIYEDFGDDAMY